MYTFIRCAQKTCFYIYRVQKHCLSPGSTGLSALFVRPVLLWHWWLGWRGERFQSWKQSGFQPSRLWLDESCVLALFVVRPGATASSVLTSKEWMTKDLDVETIQSSPKCKACWLVAGSSNRFQIKYTYIYILYGTTVDNSLIPSASCHGSWWRANPGVTPIEVK